MRGLPARQTAIIVGAGFGGIGAAIRLSQAGIDDFVVIDRAAGPGGVWHQNRYPGAACDVPSCLYSYSFVEDFEWSGTHGSWSEIVDYIDHCIDRYALRERLNFGIDVEHARWVSDRGIWEVATSEGSIEAPYLISACGLFNKPSIPDISGASTFTGPMFHSAQWDQTFDSRDRTVGILGTGCSAAQFVPELASQATRLVVFQRSPCHVMPKGQRHFSDQERELYRRFPLLRALERAGLENGTDSFVQFQFDETVRDQVTAGILASMTGQITDPEKRARLLPTYPVGGKRPISSDDFLGALNRDNVTLVSQPIEEIVPAGVRTSDGTIHALDAIVFGTGFLASEYLLPLIVQGVDGQLLQERWVDGAYAYHGMLVDGFPNFFMVYGPNSNAVGSILQMLEPQIEFIVDQIRLAQDEGQIVDVDAATVTAFNETLQAGLAASIYGLNVSTNYFSGPSGKIVTQWPGSPRQFEAAIRSIDREALLRPLQHGSRTSSKSEELQDARSR